MMVSQLSGSCSNKALFWIAVVCGICAGPRAQAVQGYFVKFADPRIFMPLIVGGNGKFIVGQSSGGKDLAIWTKNGGVKVLKVAPHGFDFLPKAVSVDGDYVAGVVQKYPARTETDQGTMFWWSAASGVHLLVPFRQNTDDVWQMDISSDGKIVEFFCPENSIIPTCPGSSSAPKEWRAMARTWTLSDGFQVMGTNIKQSFDFVKTVGDFRSFVYGDMISPSLDESESKLEGPVLSLWEESGRSIELKNVPTSLQIDESGYGYESLVEMRSIIINENASLIALPGIFVNRNQTNRVPLIWDKNGNEVFIKHLPAGCEGFVPSMITNTDEFFGLASCAGAASGVALHVTFSHAQTIADWLKERGVTNNLSLYVEINSISNNGKTILGWANLYPLAGTMQVSPNQTGGVSILKQSGGHPFLKQAYLFVAHVP